MRIGVVGHRGYAGIPEAVRTLERLAPELGLDLRFEPELHDSIAAQGRLDLVEGTYKLDVAVHRENGAPYDYHRLLHTFRVTSPVKEVGIYRPPHRWHFSGNIRLEGLR